MKKVFTIAFLFFCTHNLFSQENKDTIKFFVVENKASISKDSLLSIGQLYMTNENYEIVQFLFLVTGFCYNESEGVEWGFVKGNKFSTEMIEKIKKARKSGRSYLMIQDVFVINKKTKNRFQIKLDGVYKIQIKN